MAKFSNRVHFAVNSWDTLLCEHSHAFSRYPTLQGPSPLRLFLAHTLLVAAKWARHHSVPPACLLLLSFPSQVSTLPLPPLPSRTAEPATAMEENAASEISDWEVLSAASACGGDNDEVAIVSGGGGDVLHDHFALVPAAAAPSDGGFSGEGPWSESSVVSDGEEQTADLRLLDGFDSILQERFDLRAGVSSDQLQVVGVDEARESSVLEADTACDATWSPEGRQAEAVNVEIEQENNAARGCGELESILHRARHELGETLDSDATTVIDASQIELSENSNVQSEDVGVDARIESSCLEGVVTTDGVQDEQEEDEQRNNANSASSCEESDGEVKDGSLPLVHNTGTDGMGKRQVVWWRLPFRLLHYCAWKVKPVWSFSIAAALLGLAVLGRRMYMMRRKARGLPQIKIAIDDKRASQFADRAARLNEAFLIARRVPMLRTSSGVVLPWSMVQDR
ncbi:uncharacterized protein LOC133919099 [Phragmites australis]|uniref:uncharacterized protein LOC133919099 n=1 Tax=Phragmites australis TaxID=29695 RepID=UPI002D78AE76|nr:uncharacterized protein LOC133919099 [Phragmites australis]